MENNLDQVYEQLFEYCERENFAGYDPFDGLNSRLFQAMPIKYLAPARLAWLQMVKRSARNLRPELKIDKGVNSKGIALFALAEMSRFRANACEEHAVNARKLLETLIPLGFTLPGKTSKTAFGYNFDWQSRAFFAPRGTPTIVPTAFAAQSFLEAFKLFGEAKYLEKAREICSFIVEDLNRIDETDDEICFSYTPLDKSVIFNASLLAGECLAGVGAIDGSETFLKLAHKTATFVVNRQKENGSWAYGPKLRHAWVDNFHTAYVLLSLFRLQKLIPGFECGEAMKIGLEYWLANFFLDDGTPKYFDRWTYPIDIHSASAAVVALCELDEFDSRCHPLAEKVAAWTNANMRDPEGFFYYQKRKDTVVKTSFIRWANAWTAFSLAKLLELKKKN